MKKFKKIIFYSLIMILVLSSNLAAGTDQFSPDFFRELAEVVNEKPEIEVPDYQLMELENGMRFYLLEDKSLPIVEVRGYINGGKINESSNNAGITSLMTELMLKASKNYSESEFSLFKEINALSLNLGVGSDRISISGNSLNTETEELLSLLAEVLIRPEFAGSHFARTVAEYQQLYRQQFYNDSALLNMHFFKNLYGEHPYGYNYNYNLILEFLNQVDSKMVEDFYSKIVQPERISIAISGDFEMEALKTRLKRNFASWENASEKPAESYVSVNPKIHQKIIVVDKADATQANMRLGYNFYTSSYPKRIPFLMANRIFGSGGFNSRLMENLRSEKGYVYGTNAQVSYNDYGGAYFINLSLDPEKALAGMEAVKEEMLKLKTAKDPFQEKELFENINLYNAVFPKAYQHQIDVLEEIVYQLEFENGSKNYLNNFIKQYNGLEAAEVQQIFAEELYPEILFTVIVGPKEKILPQFKEAGLEVEVIENPVLN
ncbi:pitrilysin family protein [Halanaerobium sp.]|uniref:M16 family metallopeptidase n=1 Tax=Halanaerobium sp. TaxID=1895664 RepID=UPI000DE6E41E|nr:pitrilysin family protein [Halanaerobium sp.]PUU95154.1 MAG: peptidase M16 domain-containing protein [Halanaerobium sp.]